ncbi:methyltransferase [Rossellomorea aquimaris]|uniref:Methyltransferase n=1 Tax=Rossellomorea aquimaris TaxID=189382 RepID=A0A5D4U8S7_9BACI|nr:methyltransferase [Rossellomorea aquimaris]TYS76832.1 methyltransferase [Rossellomorea aquimaris]TYS83737.1 methyltransferase [Rossellomorea aquimaris]
MTGDLYEHHKASKLLDPKRQELVPVGKVLELLKLNKDDIVADLGCGNGYLTLPIAKMVETKVLWIKSYPHSSCTKFPT